MAKTVAPLQSFSASGKIGKSLVFFSHLGRNVVRGLVTPKNPKTEAQGAQRLLVGAAGKSLKYVNTKGYYFNNVKMGVPAGQTWGSSLVKLITQTYGTGTTGVTALKSAFSGHTKKAIFDSAAASLNMPDVTIPYAGAVTEITGGEQLYILAVNAMAVKAAVPASFDKTPYTSALADWSSANIAAFVTDVTDAI